jgi:methyl-accepting chemotaxis protein
LKENEYMVETVRMVKGGAEEVNHFQEMNMTVKSIYENEFHL